MRQGKKTGPTDGPVLGGLLAFTGLVGAGWLLDSIAPEIPRDHRSDWKMSGSIGALWPPWRRRCRGSFDSFRC